MCSWQNLTKNRVQRVYYFMYRYEAMSILCTCMYFKIFLECFILTNETKIPSKSEEFSDFVLLGEGNIEDSLAVSV
jgi:hypothetical protein